MSEKSAMHEVRGIGCFCGDGIRCRPFTVDANDDVAMEKMQKRNAAYREKHGRFAPFATQIEWLIVERNKLSRILTPTEAGEISEARELLQSHGYVIRHVPSSHTPE
jgi:hypothetical protein